MRFFNQWFMAALGVGGAGAGWILDGGIWNDAKVWVDSASWEDS